MDVHFYLINYQNSLWLIVFDPDESIDQLIVSAVSNMRSYHYDLILLIFSGDIELTPYLLFVWENRLCYYNWLLLILVSVQYLRFSTSTKAILFKILYFEEDQCFSTEFKHLKC